MKIHDLYAAILKVAKRVVNDDGTISQVFGGKSEPSLVKGKRLVAPTREHLSNSDWSNRVVFHPLSENILRGESAVLEDFRHALNIRMNWTIGLVAYQMLMIAASTDEHSKLSPYQSEYLRFVKNANEKTTLPTFKKLMQAMPLEQTQKAFVSLYLKRSGSINGRRYSRVGVVNFPLYQELCKPDVKEIWGVKFANKKDPETIKALLEHMFPGIGEEHSYSRGSDSGVAPYLDALMKSIMSVGAAVNDQIDLFSDIFAANTSEDDDAHPKNLRINDEWVSTFDNLDVMIPEIRLIPMQAGNDGAIPKTQPAQAPAAAAAPVAAAAPASPLPAALSGNNWNQPQPQPTPSVFAVAAATPGPIHTGRGLDFDSLLRSNQALAQAVGGVSAPQSNGWGGGQPQQRTPSWAQPTGNGWQGGNNGGGNMPSWAQSNQSGGNWGGGGWGGI